MVRRASVPNFRNTDNNKFKHVRYFVRHVDEGVDFCNFMCKFQTIGLAIPNRGSNDSNEPRMDFRTPVYNPKSYTTAIN